MKRFFVFCMLFIILLSICSISSIAIQLQASATDDLEIQSKSAALVDFDSGTILYEKDATTHLPIASMVKIMTILLTLEEFEKGNLTEETLITTTENASSMGGSQVFIDPYVEYSAGDLLKSVIIASANDASVALAEAISGSEKTFVNKMNEKAKELNMNDTNYVNCTGLPAPMQYSCAKDSAIVLKEVSEYDLYHKYSTIWMDELIHPSGRKTELVNTNRLIRYYDGCDGGKTGYTAEAGHCLAATAKRNGTRLISVIVGGVDSKTRFSENKALFDYGFANFESKLYLSAEKPIEQKVKVIGGKQNELSVKLEKDLTCFGRKGQSAGEIVLELPEKVKAPVTEGDEIGYAHVVVNGKKVASVKVIAAQSVKKATFWDYLKNMVK